MEKDIKPNREVSSLLSNLFKFAQEITYKPYDIDREFKKYERVKRKELQRSKTYE